ncbi:MAG: DUF5615 family PIN-like protein [Candidatus Micrarchaeota archaeon]|nr:DUF5615 family PIN-like protein [Candidatus Micrarchaeota archaeon]
MRFLIDNNLPPELCAPFEQYGHTAKHVKDTTFTRDKNILTHAIKEGYVLVSHDARFEERIVKQSCDSEGLFIQPKKEGIQAVVFPAFGAGDKGKAVTEATDIYKRIRYSCAAHLDAGDTSSAEWKNRYWELRGVPLRLGVSEEGITLNGGMAIKRRSDNGSNIGFGTIANNVASLVWGRHNDFYPRASGIRGLVSLRGFSKPKDKEEEESRKKELNRIVSGMLKSMITISFSHTRLLDIRIDREGICYRIHDRNRKGETSLNEIREIHDFEKKLNLINEKTGLDAYKVIEDQAKIVNGIEVITSHRNFLRAPMGYITKRLDMAALAGINIRQEENVTKAINKRHKQFNTWAMASAPLGKTAEMKKLLSVEPQPQSHIHNKFKPPYMVSNPSKSNKRTRI